jgi:hypothetical protein
MEQKQTLEKAIKQLNEQWLAKAERTEIRQKEEYERILHDFVVPEGVIGEDKQFTKPSEWISWMHNDSVSRIRDLETHLVDTIINLRAEIVEAEEMAATRAA